MITTVIVTCFPVLTNKLMELTGKCSACSFVVQKLIH